jgi:class 3 adenylate cyclase
MLGRKFHNLMIKFGLRYPDPTTEVAFKKECTEHELANSVRMRTLTTISILTVGSLHALFLDPPRAVIIIEITGMIFCCLFSLADLSLLKARRPIHTALFYFGAVVIMVSVMTHFGRPDRRILLVVLVVLGVFMGMTFSRHYFLRVVAGTLALGGFVGINVALGTWAPDIARLVAFVMSGCGVMGVVVSTSVEKGRRREFALKMQLGDLLNSTLPVSVVKRLLNAETESHLVDKVDEATVMFLDIVGFTRLAEEKSPERLIEILDGIFSRLDVLVDKTPAEKIKTIGDSYMVVCGIPEPHQDHMAIIADLALDFREAIKRYSFMTGEDLTVRIGINSGPVVAGIIGRGRMQYDLWGDTVNVASRMESHGLSGEIQVTEVIYQQLKSKFKLRERGVIEIKNKEPQMTYLLEGATYEKAREDESPRIQNVA